MTRIEPGFKGAKLVGAVVDTAANPVPEATATVVGGVKKGAAVAPITPAADGTAAGTALNALIASLKAAGVIA